MGYDILPRLKLGPLLKKLGIQARYHPELGIHILARLWRQASSIRTLAFYGPGSEDFVGHAHTGYMQGENFPFDQITSLELTCPINHEGLYALMSAMPSLQNATLNYIYHADEEQHKVVAVQELCTLSLGGPSYVLKGQPTSAAFKARLNLGSRSSKSSSCGLNSWFQSPAVGGVSCAIGGASRRIWHLFAIAAAAVRRFAESAEIPNLRFFDKS